MTRFSPSKITDRMDVTRLFTSKGRRAERGTQTDTHLQEPFKDEKYEWNEWDCNQKDWDEWDCWNQKGLDEWDWDTKCRKGCERINYNCRCHIDWHDNHINYNPGRVGNR